MQILRLLLVSLVCGTMLWLLLNTLWNGLRTGKMRWRDSTSFCDRNKQPLFYWFLVFIFAGFSILILATWVRSF
jgi:hypothetical protein